MTLKGKFTLISGIVVLVVALTVVTNVVTLRSLTAKTDATEDSAEMIQHHLNADMMHDAIHADVLRVLYAATQHDAATAAEAQRDLRSHAQQLTRSIDAALKMKPPAEIERQLTAFAARAAEYRDTAQKLAAAAGRGDTADMSAFNAGFAEMETQAADISAALDKQLNALNADEDATAVGAQTRDEVMAIVTILAALSVPFFSRRQVFYPQERLIRAMEEISGGRLDGEIPYLEREDEIGAVARALKVFQRNAVEKQRLEIESEAAKKRNEEEKRKAMFGLADHFEANVKSVADTVASAATEMDATSRDVLRRAADSGDKLAQLVRGINGASQNVQTVAAAATELSASIREIGAQVDHGNSIMSEAVAEATRANSQAASLSDAASRIGSVIDVINEVTGQINLLALNATIEAARAGEQGRGFAVVASEIKNLASQTTAATRQVEEQIKLIQGAAGETVTVLQKISDTIGSMNKVSTSIAAAVEEQGMATQEIARNVQQAAEITTMVSTNANDVRETSAGASSAVSQMIAAASDLSRQSETLRAQVGAFLKDIKAA